MNATTKRRTQAAAAAEARAKGMKSPRPSTTSSSSFASSTFGATQAAPQRERLSDEQNMQLLKYVGIGLVGVMVLKVILNSLVMIYVAMIPFLAFYAIQTCPTAESFEAKKEIKRVMRGHHLPNDHPNKPKGYFEQMAARVAATVTTELATMPGYEISMATFGGLAIMTTVTIPTVKIEYYWIGAFGRWFYVYNRELTTTNRND